MAISFNELLEALEIADTKGLGIDNEVYICRQTGKIYWQSDYLSDLEEDQLPDDIEDGTKYVQVPDRHDLDLGKALVLSFVREVLPDDYDDVRIFLNKRGGYRKFRALAQHRHVLDRWYAFEQQATQEALRDWCKTNGIELTDT